MKRTKWQVFFLLITIALALLAPRAMNHLPTDVQPTEAPYRGVLKLQVMEGYAGAGTSWLSRIVSQFERKNPGVRIIISRTTPQAFAALPAADLPDLVCFAPGDLLDAPRTLMPLQIAQGLREQFVRSAQVDDTLYAAPVFYSGYCLLANAQKIPSPPKDWYEALTALKGGTAKKPTYGLNCAVDTARLYSLALCQLFDDSFPSGIALEKGTLLPSNFLECTQEQVFSSFVKGDCAAMVGGAREIFQLQSLEETTIVPMLAISSNGGFTEQVGYIGIPQRKEQSKNTAYATSFIDLLLKEDSQQKLSTHALFSVREGLLTQQEQMGLAQIEQAYQNELLVPNAFFWHVMREKAVTYANGILSGSIAKDTSLSSVLEP